MEACPLMWPHDGISTGWKFVGSRPRGCSPPVARRRAQSRDASESAARASCGGSRRDRCEVSPGACLAPLGRARLDAATSSQTREGAERDRNPALGDDALARGKKNARRRRAWIIFQDESGVSQRPPVRRTWAPRGETAALIHAFNWAKLSLAVGLAFRWDFRRSGLFFQTRPGSYNDVSLIGFLNELKRHFGGRRLLLIWDGLPSHKSRNMTAYLATQRSWLTMERLPGYAPGLNPTELVWGNVKGRELANLCADNLGEVERAVRTGLRRVRRAPTLAFAFLRHAGLSF